MQEEPFDNVCNGSPAPQHAMKNVATFEEVIKVKRYIKSGRWIIIWNDFYGNEPRMKKTGDKVLELIGKLMTNSTHLEQQ